MKRFLLVFLVLLLAACTGGETLPATAPVAAVQTPLPPTALPTVTETATAVAPTATALSESTVTAAASPTPTLLPTVTQPPTPTPTPGPPFTEGMIAILRNPQREEFERVVTYQLDLALPGPSPDEWTVQTVLTDVTAPYIFPSPDGRKLALPVYEDTNEDGYIPSLRGGDGYIPHLYFLDNGSLVPLSSSTVFNFPDMEWLPDSEQFTYLSNQDVFIASVETAQPPQVLLSLPHRTYSHAWSPDGRWMALFSSVSDEPMLASEIARLDVYNRDTGELTNIATGIGEGNLFWSPDSQSLAYTHNTGTGLSVVELSTGMRTEIISLDIPANTAAWSPEGRWLAVIKNHVSLHLWDPETAQLTELIPADDSRFLNWSRALQGHTLSWLPDSSRVLITVIEKDQVSLKMVDTANGDWSQIISVPRLSISEREELNAYINPLRLLSISLEAKWLMIYAELENGVSGLQVIDVTENELYTVMETDINDFTTLNVAWLPSNILTP